MNKKAVSNTFFLIAIFFSIAAAVTSCKKTSPCEAIVIVYDTLGRPVQGATVILRQDSVVSQQTGVQADIYDSKITDFDGRTLHEFKWEAVLVLEASKGTLNTRDYIILKQSESVTKEVTIRK